MYTYHVYVLHLDDKCWRHKTKRITPLYIAQRCRSWKQTDRDNRRTTHKPQTQQTVGQRGADLVQVTTSLPTTFIFETPFTHLISETDVPIPAMYIKPKYLHMLEDFAHGVEPNAVHRGDRHSEHITKRATTHDSNFFPTRPAR